MLKLATKARGHFVTLIEINMHLMTCISGARFSEVPANTGPVNFS